MSAQFGSFRSVPFGFNHLIHCKTHINAGFSTLKPLNYHDKFDLGDISIEVVNMEGHTKGSVGFLIKEDKLLVTSDAACPFVWLFLEESDLTFKMD